MLPSDLKVQWRHILATLFLSEKRLFSARHNSLPYNRSITYRVDVGENILKQVASSPHWTLEENDDKPTIKEILSCAKVWLSFPESQAANAFETNATLTSEHSATSECRGYSGRRNRHARSSLAYTK